jgi:hypothetical protein
MPEPWGILCTQSGHDQHERGTNSQKLMLFRRGNAVLGAPIVQLSVQQCNSFVRTCPCRRRSHPTMLFYPDPCHEARGKADETNQPDAVDRCDCGCPGSGADAEFGSAFSSLDECASALGLPRAPGLVFSDWGRDDRRWWTSGPDHLEDIANLTGTTALCADAAHVDPLPLRALKPNFPTRRKI